MGRGRARTTRPAASGPVRWLRLAGRQGQDRGLVLDFVAETAATGHGQHVHQLGELLAAGDRVRVVIRLGGPTEVTIELLTRAGIETSLGGGGTPAAEETTHGPPEEPPPPPAEGGTSSFPTSIEAAKEEETGEEGWVQGGAVPVYDLPALAAEVAADSLRGMPCQVMTQPAPPADPDPEPRQVAITQELAPLERIETRQQQIARLRAEVASGAYDAGGRLRQRLGR